MPAEDLVYRAFTSPLATAPQDASRRKFYDTDYYVEGYATTFNQPYELCYDIREQIAPTVLDGADVSDVIFQFDHEGMVFARNRAGNLHIASDSHGIFIAADLGRTEDARRLYESIAAGLVDRMSWAFIVAEETWDNENDLRTITKVKKVFDVSAVSIPANDATAISARSFAAGVIEARKAQEKRRRKQIQLKALIAKEIMQ